VARKLWSWIRGLSDIVTLIQFGGSVGFAGFLAIVGQGALNAALGLSPVLRLLLAICIFLMALAVVLAVLKALLERASQSKAAQAPAPQSSDFQPWQELRRVESENEQLRATLQEREREINRYKAQGRPLANQMQFRLMLQSVRSMGHNLNSAQPPDVVAIEKWASLTSALIRRALGEEIADFFLVDDGDSSFTGRLNRLEHILLNEADVRVYLRHDFNVDEALTILESYPDEWSN
jgi:hypothetical protein